MTEVQPLTETETEDLEALPEDAPLVGIIIGSKRDQATMEQAGAVLAEHDVRHETRVLSAHEDGETLAEYCRNARMRGLRVIIAAAAPGAALPGLAAAHTDLPVIAVPLTSSLDVADGLDAVLSVVQAPSDVPVAAVAMDNPRNAAHVALRVLRA